MREKTKYGAIFAGGGVLVALLGASVDISALMQAGTVGLVIGGALLYLAFEKWYCAACGQFLGRGEKPGSCERCGSNRVTNSDPGAVR